MEANLDVLVLLLCHSAAVHDSTPLSASAPRSALAKEELIFLSFPFYFLSPGRMGKLGGNHLYVGGKSWVPIVKPEDSLNIGLFHTTMFGRIPSKECPARRPMALIPVFGTNQHPLFTWC